MWDSATKDATGYVQGSRQRLVEVNLSRINSDMGTVAWKVHRAILPTIEIEKLKKAIANFEQMGGESLYEEWERYKGLLRIAPKMTSMFNKRSPFSMMG